MVQAARRVGSLCSKGELVDRVVCFDLWNTLMRSPEGGAGYESVLLEHGVPAEQIFPFVRDYLMTRRMSYEEMAKALFHRFAIEPATGALDKLVKLWSTDNKHAAIIPHALQVVKTLRRRGRIAVLVTNSTAPGWHAVSRIRSEFDYAYISCDEGNVKPNLSVWETIESWFPTVDRNEFVMVGDREIDDLATPRKRGWKAIPADSMGMLVGNQTPTTLLMDTAHQIDEKKLRALGINPLQTTLLTAILGKWRGWKTLNPETTIVVVPGNGASITAHDLFNQLPQHWYLRVVRIAAKRCWNPGSEPWAVASPIFPGRMLLGIRDVVVIDDVVASGATVRKIYDLNRPWIPGARWHALTWLAQRSTSLPGEVSLVAAAHCGNFVKREPIASVSTLTTDSGVLESFAQRNSSKELVEIFSSLHPHPLP